VPTTALVFKDVSTGCGVRANNVAPHSKQTVANPARSEFAPVPIKDKANKPASTPASGKIVIAKAQTPLASKVNADIAHAQIKHQVNKSAVMAEHGELANARLVWMALCANVCVPTIVLANKLVATAYGKLVAPVKNHPPNVKPTRSNFAIAPMAHAADGVAKIMAAGEIVNVALPPALSAKNKKLRVTAPMVSKASDTVCKALTDPNGGRAFAHANSAKLDPAIAPTPNKASIPASAIKTPVNGQPVNAHSAKKMMIVAIYPQPNCATSANANASNVWRPRTVKIPNAHCVRLALQLVWNVSKTTTVKVAICAILSPIFADNLKEVPSLVRSAAATKVNPDQPVVLAAHVLAMIKGHSIICFSQAKICHPNTAKNPFSSIKYLMSIFLTMTPQFPIKSTIYQLEDGWCMYS
jgi:hypothetical protein